MPRTPKDPNNPITKLRRQLSSPNQPLTRDMFAKRYGFSVETLKALETGRYKLSRGVAIKIAVAVGVDASCPLENRDPLVDWNGNPITPETKPALRHLDLNANERLQFLVKAGFAAAKKRPKGDQSALYVVLFDFWLADVMRELDVRLEFWDELFDGSEEFVLGADPQKEKTLKYIHGPEEVSWKDYGFDELVARGLARPVMLEAEKKRLLLEYLTPAEIADYDVPIDFNDSKLGGPDSKLGEPERIAHRRFAKSKGPDDEEAVRNAFWDEAWRRFEEKERNWAQGHRE